MNAGIINALNSVATAAIAKNDMNTLSLLQDAACMIYKIGTIYDSTAYNASATAYLNPYITPNNGELFDAMAVVAKANGLTPQQLGG